MRRLIYTSATVLLPLVGCQTYRPVGATIPENATVRIRFAQPRPVAESDGSRHTELTGVSRVTGTLLAMRGDTITIRPTSLDMVGQDTGGLRTNGVITVVRDAATDVEVLQKDKDRTAVAWIVGGLAGFYVLLIAAAAVIVMSAQ